MTATQLAFAGVVDTAPFSPDAPWQSLPLVSVDTETTGPDPATARLIEVAAIWFARGRRLDRWVRLVNPGVPVPDEAAAIHGITTELVSRAPSLDTETHEDPETGEVLTLGHQLADRLGARVRVGYNLVTYDLPILARELGVVGVPLPPAPALDVLTWVRKIDRFVPGKGRHRLAAACERRGIRAEGLHRAEADAVLTIRLLAAIRDELPETIGEVLTEQARLARDQEEDFRRWQESAAREGVRA